MRNLNEYSEILREEFAEAQRMLGKRHGMYLDYSILAEHSAYGKWMNYERKDVVPSKITKGEIIGSTELKRAAEIVAKEFGYGCVSNRTMSGIYFFKER